MEMTPERAKRILEYKPHHTKLSTTEHEEIVTDWLEGMTYPEMTAKYKVSKSTITKIVHNARQEAKETLQEMGVEIDNGTDA